METGQPPAGPSVLVSLGIVDMSNKIDNLYLKVLGTETSQIDSVFEFLLAIRVVFEFLIGSCLKEDFKQFKIKVLC